MTSTSFFSERPLFLFSVTVAAVLLFASWLWPTTHLLWSQIDFHSFTALNQWMGRHPKFHHACALFVTLESDLFLIAALAAIALRFLFGRGEPKNWSLRCAQLLFVGGMGLLGLLLIKKGLIDGVLGWNRLSPSIAIEGAVRSNALFEHLHASDASAHSFPSDHAIALLYATLFFAIFGGTTLGIACSMLLLPFCLARLCTGAHWASDMAAGSIPFVLLLFTWTLATPLYGRCIVLLEKGVRKFYTVLSPRPN